MKALISKDWYNLRSYMLKQAGLFVIIYLIIALSMKSLSMFSAMFSMSIMMLSVSTFAFDDMSHFNTYALTLPLARKDIVRAKYVLTYGMIVLCCVFTALTCILVDSFTFRGGAMDIVITTLAVLVTYWIMISILLPFYLALPAEKARGWMTIGMMVPFFLVFFGFSWLKNRGLLSEVPWVGLAIVVAVLALVAPIVSYSISVRLFARKQF